MKCTRICENCVGHFLLIVILPARVAFFAAHLLPQHPHLVGQTCRLVRCSVDQVRGGQARQQIDLGQFYSPVASAVAKEMYDAATQVVFFMYVRAY
jgi:hypothetical protein